MDPKQKRVHKIFIGYKTRTVEGIEKLLPEFKAPSHWKDKDKIAADVAEKREAFLANAKDMPYTGTLSEVTFVDSFTKKTLQWKDDPEKPPVSVRVRNYLLKNYPDAWSNDTHDRKPPTVILVGFDPRTFLKILGLECSLPKINKPCPLGLWYTNTDHRDIAEAVMPKDFKGLTLPYVLKFREPIDPADAAKWKELVKDWPGPGVFSDRDALLTVALATQLDLLSE